LAADWLDFSLSAAVFLSFLGSRPDLFCPLATARPSRVVPPSLYHGSSEPAPQSMRETPGQRRESHTEPAPTPTLALWATRRDERTRHPPHRWVRFGVPRTPSRPPITATALKRICARRPPSSPSGVVGPAQMPNTVRRFPARPLTPKERACVAEWIAAAGDVALTYVSSRQSDDPAHRHRIVVLSNVGEKPSHFVHAPPNRDIWMVISPGRRTKIQRFRALRDALNSIRPVLADLAPIRLAGSRDNRH